MPDALASELTHFTDRTNTHWPDADRTTIPGVRAFRNGHISTPDQKGTSPGPRPGPAVQLPLPGPARAEAGPGRFGFWSGARRSRNRGNARNIQARRANADPAHQPSGHRNVRVMERHNAEPGPIVKIIVTANLADDLALGAVEHKGLVGFLKIQTIFFFFRLASQGNVFRCHPLMVIAFPGQHRLWLKTGSASNHLR